MSKKLEYLSPKSHAENSFLIEDPHSMVFADYNLDRILSNQDDFNSKTENFNKITKKTENLEKLDTERVGLKIEEHNDRIAIENRREEGIMPACDSFNFLSRTLLLHHISSFLRLYFKIVRKKEKISFKHIHLLSKFRNLKYFVDQMNYLFDKFVKKKGGKPTEFELFQLFLKIFGWSLLLTYFLWTAHTCLVMVFTIFINYLLESLNDSDEKNKYIWAMILSVGVLFQLFLQNQCWNLTFQINGNFRSTIILLLYKKIIALNNYSIQKANIGKLINIIANDMNIIEFKLPFAIILFTTPISLILSLYLLWWKLGPISLITIVALCLIYLVQKIVSTANVNNIRGKNIFSDQRIKTCSEMIEGIRLLKMYGWEITVKNIIDKLRNDEIKKLNSYCTYIMGDRGVSINSSILVALIVFFSFYMVNDNGGALLTPSLVFSIYQLLEYARIHQVAYVGMGFSIFYELKVVFKRIIDVLTIQETHAKSINYFNDEKSEFSLIIKDYYSYWDENSSEFFLSNLNMTLKRGHLYSLIGKVGSGKSSVLYSILGEIPKFDGSITSQKSIAYVEQEPFIIIGTVRSNILFQKKFDQDLYEKVINVCCLKKDFKSFANGDLTEIGEKGINLSGGQKARISLARALYSEAELYLLDDPISALDAKIGRKVFNRAIKNFLKDKCVLFITHQIQFLKEVDYIFLIEKGSIIKEGDFEYFKTHLSNYFDEHHQDEEKNLDPISSLSIPSKKEEAKIAEIQSKEKGKLFELEENEEIEVNLKTYRRYISYAKNPFYLISLVSLYILCEVNRFGTIRLLSQFGQNEMPENHIFGSLLALTLSLIMLAISKYYVLCKLILVCNKNLHERMSESIVRAPTVFFDTHQTGVILNRFSNDLALMDNLLVFTLVDFLDIVIGFFVAIIVAGAINPWYFLVVSVACCILFSLFYIGKPVILGLKKFDLQNKSPIFSFFSTTLAGITTINVYKRNQEFECDFLEVVKKSIRCNFDFFEISRGFSMLVDFTSKISSIFGIFLTMWLSDKSSGIIGQQIIYLLAMSEALQWGLRQFINADSVMNSAIRAMNYGKIPSEDTLIKEKDSLLVSNKKTERTQNVERDWPSEGVVEFSNVDLRYRPHLEPVISNFSLHITAGEKVGVVGRTGAGKSSLIQTFFRMYELSNGEIKIDGVDIKTIGLHTLRKKISIIPQIPFMFNETIRKNLDPLQIYSENELWQALENVELKEYVTNMEQNLETRISNNTNSFSVGQKQLLCLARAILQKNKILVLDEATANVDLETDKIIQKKIKEVFTHSTIVTIAHRLFTIVDYDRVLVMEKGKIVEYDNPLKLLVYDENDEEITKNGYFADMVKNTGVQPAKKFLEAAKKAYFEKKKNIKRIDLPKDVKA